MKKGDLAKIFLLLQLGDKENEENEGYRVKKHCVK